MTILPVKRLSPSKAIRKVKYNNSDIRLEEFNEELENELIEMVELIEPVEQKIAEIIAQIRGMKGK
jgi:gamma-glutamyl:cysteine ligase YbdK (ATP-grasp superfamily)